MSRNCVKYPVDKFIEEFPQFKDAGVTVYLDTKNLKELAPVIQKNADKFRRILHVIFSFQYNNALYRKEGHTNKTRNVTAMKFLGGANERIYCKEFFDGEKKIVMITALAKKVQKNDKSIRNLIERIGDYEYEFE
ncbi:hypothetical protein ACFS7Z_19785 [Pontibacter toksunensis]|uniref:Uncharacterized protein n=1 Tax=Pontibacter toksunensis TaxID=1332631 RepID=A0ABW6C057_9BACT